VAGERTRLAVLGVAVVVGVSGCSYGFGPDDGVSHPPRTIDEVAGTIAGVGLGSSEAEIRAAFGSPVGGGGFAPEGEKFRGPEAIVTPTPPRLRTPPQTLRYEETSFLLTRRTGAYAVMTTNERDATAAGVAVGDPLDTVRSTYQKVRCGTSVAGEPLFGGETRTYPWCRARVGDVDVFFGDDPIEAITLVRG
jgi:hypothetical protein